VALSQIEKKIVLKATQDRAWGAISDSSKFGQWFGVEVDGPFVAGHEAVGRIAPTNVDPEVARLQDPYRGAAWRVTIEQIEPKRLFSFRWHPFAINPNYDYSAEPMTLVTFELAEVESGVLLTIKESGFEQLPTARRAPAIEANDGGWALQAQLIEKYLLLEEGR
jgi:uncharacterized protein YndB with AHSA1/START domain